METNFVSVDAVQSENVMGLEKGSAVENTLFSHRIQVRFPTHCVTHNYL